ncbi:MAG: preprotein translocase subunit YajC [Acidimicrobiales bacterium]
MGGLILLAVTFLLMWVFFVLPQQRRMRAHQALVASLEVGDDVVTTAGLYGTITALEGDVVSLEIAPGIVVRLARGAVGSRVADNADNADTGNADNAERDDEAPRPTGTAADRAVESDANE